VLAVRIVVLVEGVELRDSVQDCNLAGLAKRDHASGHDQHTAGKGLAQMIVQMVNRKGSTSVDRFTISYSWDGLPLTNQQCPQFILSLRAS
jgi:hypothetical protein